MIKKQGYMILLVIIGSIAFLFSPCLVKLTTGYPCPACGTRRSLITLLQGEPLNSFMINPYGIIGIIIGITFIVAGVIDFFAATSLLTLLSSFFNKIFRNKLVLAILVLGMLMNWYWNICKGL